MFWLWFWRSVQEIKEMRGGGESGGPQRDGQRPVLSAPNWLRSAPSDLVKWSGPKRPVMVLGGLKPAAPALN